VVGARGGEYFVSGVCTVIGCAQDQQRCRHPFGPGQFQQRTVALYLEERERKENVTCGDAVTVMSTTGP
jgi:hypothetical protein